MRKDDCSTMNLAQVREEYRLVNEEIISLLCSKKKLWEDLSRSFEEKDTMLSQKQYLVRTQKYQHLDDAIANARTRRDLFEQVIPGMMANGMNFIVRAEHELMLNLDFEGNRRVSCLV